MSKLSILEYWALYVLQFGRAQLWQPLTQEEDDFVSVVARDLYPHDADNQAFGLAIDNLRKLADKEERDDRLNSTHD
jgi:hypothetical protein